MWEGFKRHIVTCIIFSCSLALGQLDSTQFNVMLRKLASCTVAEVLAPCLNFIAATVQLQTGKDV